MIVVIIILAAFGLGFIYMAFPGYISIEKLQRLFKRESQSPEN